MSYCGTALIDYLSQVSYSQVGFSSLADLHSFEGTLIPQASKFIDSYVGGLAGTFAAGTFTFDGTGKDVLFFPPKYTPLIGISKGTINSVAITITDLKVHDQFAQLDGGYFTKGKHNVVLYGSYGYASTPSDIEFVCGQLCANILLDMVRKKVAPDLFKAAATPEGITALFASAEVFPANLREKLDAYKVSWVDVG